MSGVEIALDAYYLVVKTQIPLSPAKVASVAKWKLKFMAWLILGLWLPGTLYIVLLALLEVIERSSWRTLTGLLSGGTEEDRSFASLMVGWWPLFTLACVAVAQVALWPSLIRLVSGSILSTPRVPSLACGLLVSCLVAGGGVGLSALDPDKVTVLGLAGSVVLGIVVFVFWTKSWLRKCHDLDPREVILRQNSLLLKLGLLWLLPIGTACFLLPDGWLMAWVNMSGSVGVILSALLPKALLLLTGKRKEMTLDGPIP